MNFLLDECAPRKIVNLLRKQGHSIQTLIELKKQGIQNGAVAVLAKNQQAIIITRDTDFLKLERNLQNKSRIIVLLINPPDPTVILHQLNEYLHRCLEHLKNPGKVIITNSNCIFLKPEEIY